MWGVEVTVPDPHGRTQRYTVIRWRLHGRTVAEDVGHVDGETVPAALAEATSAERGTVVLVALRRDSGGGGAPFQLYVRDYSLPIPARGDLRPFGTVQVPQRCDLADAVVERLRGSWADVAAVGGDPFAVPGLS